MSERSTEELIDLNVGWLRQALDLVQRIAASMFASSPAGLEPHRVGSHLRHVLEFYQCFLNGIPHGRVDYDQRRRERNIETEPAAAAARIASIIRELEEIPASAGDQALAVRMENAESDVWLGSTVGRELQALSSHTIHHFALIAVTLKVHGVRVHPDFGMSPSTLRYQAAHSREAA